MVAFCSNCFVQGGQRTAQELPTPAQGKSLQHQRFNNEHAALNSALSNAYSSFNSIITAEFANQCQSHDQFLKLQQAGELAVLQASKAQQHSSGVKDHHITVTIAGQARLSAQPPPASMCCLDICISSFIMHSHALAAVTCCCCWNTATVFATVRVLQCSRRNTNIRIEMQCSPEVLQSADT
jgi:hypothetical protein